MTLTKYRQPLYLLLLGFFLIPVIHAETSCPEASDIQYDSATQQWVVNGSDLFEVTGNSPKSPVHIKSITFNGAQGDINSNVPNTLNEITCNYTFNFDNQPSIDVEATTSNPNYPCFGPTKSKWDFTSDEAICNKEQPALCSFSLAPPSC